MPFYRLTGLPFCGLTILPHYSLAFLPPYRLAALTSYRLIALLPRRLTALPSYRFSVLPSYCFFDVRLTILQFHHVASLSSCRLTASPSVKNLARDIEHRSLRIFVQLSGCAPAGAGLEAGRTRNT